MQRFHANPVPSTDLSRANGQENDLRSACRTWLLVPLLVFVAVTPFLGTLSASAGT
jgi:hypothetical protein